MKKLAFLIIGLIISANADAATGLQKITCHNEDLRHPLWTGEYYVAFDTPFYGLIVVQEIIRRDKTCQLGRDVNLFVGNCDTLNFEPLTCE